MRSFVTFACALVLVLPYVAVQGSQRAAAAGPLTNTVYLPNITKMLGGPDGWQTPFIVQNVGSSPTDLTIDFFAFSDGSLVKTRSVTGLAPGTSIFHDPNSDTGLAPGGQYSVVIRSFGSPVVSVVNEHQNVTNTSRQEALSYLGLSSGSTRIFAPYAANNAAGWLTTFIIQNLGPASTTVTAQFRDLGGPSTVSVTRTIAPGRSQFVDPRVEPGIAPGGEYGVALSADQPIGLVVNAHNDAPGTIAPRGFSYNGIPAPSGTNVFVPYAQKNVNGATTRLIIQNAGTTSASPQVRFRLAAQFATPIVVQGPALAAGASWIYDAGTNAGIADGEYGVTVVGGEFAAVAAALGPTSVAGSASTDARSTTLYFPNVTKTLGGPNGWTTPIAVQSTGATSATLRWYRFSDGALAFTQVLLFNEFAQTFKVDPRQIPDLPDNSQYAVVATAGPGGFGGIAGIVTELNFSGGDGAMHYEGVRPPAALPFGTTGCTPASAPSGATFHCVFYGLPAGSVPTSIAVSSPSGGSTAVSPNFFVVGVDGSIDVPFHASAGGSRTMTITVGAQTASGSFNVTAPSFTILFVENKWGSVTVKTLPGIVCSLDVLLPGGQLLNDDAGTSPRITNAQGNVAWIYNKPAGVTGTGFNIVSCTSGAETPSNSAPFTAP